MGEEPGADFVAALRREVRRSVDRSLGVGGGPPPKRPTRGKLFLPKDAVARRVHGDLASMVIGGVASLFLQTLHPLAMAGVADHSTYREDALARLRRTAHFVGVTTFGTAAEAQGAITSVKEIHRHVRGRAPDGRRYSASTPELLTWVHAAETACFLEAAQRYGPRRLSQEECDRYYQEVARVPLALGARWVPTSRAEASAYLLRIRPELYAGPQAIEARNFLLRGVSSRPLDRAVYAGIVAGALTVVPRWARGELRIAAPPFADELLAPLVRSFSSTLRFLLRP